MAVNQPERQELTVAQVGASDDGTSSVTLRPAESLAVTSGWESLLDHLDIWPGDLFDSDAYQPPAQWAVYCAASCTGPSGSGFRIRLQDLDNATTLHKFVIEPGMTVTMIHIFTELEMSAFPTSRARFAFQYRLRAEGAGGANFYAARFYRMGNPRV